MTTPTAAPSEKSLQTLFTLVAQYQDKLNDKIAAQWKTRNLNSMVRQKLQAMEDAGKPINWRDLELPFHRAIYVEAVEGIDHINAYKWWKAAKSNLPQAHMELVDILHFLASFHLESHDAREVGSLYAQAALQAFPAVVELGSNPVPDFTNRDFCDIWHDEMDRLVSTAAACAPDAYQFFKMVVLSGLSFEELGFQYMMKNVLNAFRWDNGYQEDTYIKDWMGQEDNQFLEHYMSENRTALVAALERSENIGEALYGALAAQYALVVQAANKA